MTQTTADKLLAHERWLDVTGAWSTIGAPGRAASLRQPPGPVAPRKETKMPMKTSFAGNGAAPPAGTAPTKARFMTRVVVAAAERAVEAAAQTFPVQAALTSLAQQLAVASEAVPTAIQLNDQAITELAQSDDYVATVERVYGDTMRPSTRRVIERLVAIRSEGVLETVAAATVGLSAVNSQTAAVAVSGQPAAIQLNARAQAKGDRR